MKHRKIAAIILALALVLPALFDALPTTASAEPRGGSTDTWCAYDPTGTHRWTEWATIKKPTCTSKGRRSRICLNDCGVVQYQDIPALGHKYGGWKVITEATCSSTGSRQRKCSVCGNVDAETVQKLPHTWGEWTVIEEPTDHSAGTRSHTCTVCGTEETEAFDPEGTLRRGDKGGAVKALQESLICYGALKAGGADGSFGPGTESAVKQVQEAEGLAVDGVAWPQTQAVLGHQFGEWEVVSVKTDFSIGLRTRTCARCGFVEQEQDIPSPMYKRGDKGDDVKALQEALNAAGFDCGKADGDFGKKTEAAIKAFEEAHGLEADGIAWPGIIKLINGDTDILFGDEADGGLAVSVQADAEAWNPGETIEIIVTVTNTGDEPINQLGAVLTLVDEEQETQDDVDEAWVLGDPDAALAPGETATVTLHYTITAQDAERDAWYLMVRAEGYTVDSGDYCVDTANVYPVIGSGGNENDEYEGGLAVSAQAGAEAWNPGETIEIIVTVTNTGDEPINQLGAVLTLVDEEQETQDDVDEAWVLGDPDATLAPGESATVALHYTITAQDVERDAWYLMVRAESYTADSGDYCVDTANVYPVIGSGDAGSDEGLIVSGHVDQETFAANETIAIHITIENSGDEAIAVTSLKLERVLPDYTSELVEDIPTDGWQLASGESIDRDIQYTATEADAAQGSLGLRILCKAQGLETDKALDDGLSYYFTLAALAPEIIRPDLPAVSGLIVEAELTEPDRVYAAGEPVPMDISVTCVSKTRVEDVEVWLEPLYAGTDDFIYEPIEGVGNLDTFDYEANIGLIGLDPGENWSRHHDKLVFPEEVAALGSFDVAVVARASYPETGEYFEVRARVTVTTREGPGEAGLRITAAAREQYFAPGVPLEIDVSVGNTGKASVNGVALSLEPGSDGNEDGKAQPFAFWPDTFKQGTKRSTVYTYTPTLEDVAKSQLHFTFAADGKNAETGESAGAGFDLYVLRAIDAPALTFTVEADSEAFIAGQPVMMTLTATNSGTVPLKGLLLADELPGQALFGDVGELLMPGQSRSALLPVKSTREDWADHPSGWTLEWTLSACTATKGEPLEATAGVTLARGEEQPGITVTAVPDSWYYVPGVPVNYVIIAENTGNVALENVQLLHAAPYMKLSPDEALFKPGEKRTFEWSTVHTYEESLDGALKEYEFTVGGNALGSGAYVEGSGGFKLAPAQQLSMGAGLRVDVEEPQDGMVYQEKQTAILYVHLENTGDEAVKDIRVVVQHLNVEDGRAIETTVVPLDGAELQPGDATTYKHPYVIQYRDVVDGRASLKITAVGVGDQTGNPCYDYKSWDLATTKDQGSGWGTQTAQDILGDDFGQTTSGLSLRKGGEDIKTILGLRVTPGKVTRQGEDYFVDLTVTNVSSDAVYLSGASADSTGEGMGVCEFGAIVEGETVPISPWEMFPLKDPLQPGESAQLSFHTTVGDADQGNGVISRRLTVLSYIPGEGDTRILVRGVCDVSIPLEANAQTGLCLSAGNLTHTGGESVETVVLKLRAENRSDAALEVHMSLESSDGMIEDPDYCQWMGCEQGVFTLEPHASLDFSVILRPTMDELYGYGYDRLVKATAAQTGEVASVSLEIPLIAAVQYGRLEISGTTANGLTDGAFHADFDVRRVGLMQDLEAASLTDVRVRGEVLGPDGSCLDTFELVSEMEVFSSDEICLLSLDYPLTEDQIALGDITFLAWAEGAVVAQGESDARPIVSWNTWRQTVRAGSGPEAGETALGSLSIAAALSEGDRLYKAGEPIPVDITITYAGENPIRDFLIAFDPMDPATGSFLYDFDIDGQLSFWGEGELAPGQPWTMHFDGLILPESVAQQMNACCIEPWVGATDSVTGEYMEARGPRLTVRTVENDAGMILILETDAQDYSPDEPVVFRVGIHNEGEQPLDDVQVWCRRGTEAQANKPNWVEVVMELDEPVQPGDTVWREEFNCWPTAEQEGGDMFIRFSANAWYGPKDTPQHAAAERRMILPMRAELALDENDNAGIAIQADDHGVDAFSPGEPLNIALAITNSGELPLEDLQLTVRRYNGDELKDTEVFPLLSEGEALPAEGGVDYPYSYTPGDGETAPLVFKFEVSGKLSDSDQRVSDAASAWYYRAGEALGADDLRLTATAAWDGENHGEGGVIHYVLTVENIGQEPVSGLSLRMAIMNEDFTVRSQSGNDEYGDSQLAPGEAVTAEWDYTVEPGDAASGVVRADFTAVALAAGSGGVVTGRENVLTELDDDLTRIIEAGSPEVLTLEYTVDEDRVYAEDELAHFDVTVVNQGDAPLGPYTIAVTLYRSDGSEIGGTTLGLSEEDGLEPNDVHSTDFNYTVTPEDMADGLVRIVFKAFTEATEASASAYAEAEYILYTAAAHGPGAEDAEVFISCESDETGFKEGDVIHYNLEIQNAGKRDLTYFAADVTMLDGDENVLLAMEIAEWPDWVLAPGEKLPAGWDYTITAEDVERGFVRAQFTVSASDAQTYDPLSSNCGWTVYLDPFSGEAAATDDETGGAEDEGEDEGEEGGLEDLTIAKTVIGQSEFAEGYHLFEYINYAITVTNHSPDIVAVTVYDECAGGAPDALGTSWLPPDESETYFCCHEVGKSDVVDGEVVNEAYAVITQIAEGSTVFDPGETFYAEPVTAPTTWKQPPVAQYPDAYTLDIVLEEVSQPEQGDAYRLGEEIRYEITITNPTANTINYIWVFDEMGDSANPYGYLACVTLGFGQRITLPCAHTVTEADVKQGSVKNTGKALIAIINAEGDVEDVWFKSAPVTVNTAEAP